MHVLQMAGSNIRYGMGVTQEVGLVRQADLFIKKIVYFFLLFLLLFFKLVDWA